MPAMDTAETDDMLSMLLDSAGAFLADRHDLRRLRLGAQASSHPVDPAIWRQMAELGWLGLGLPEGLGGAGLPLHTGAALCERLGTRPSAGAAHCLRYHPRCAARRLRGRPAA